MKEFKDLVESEMIVEDAVIYDDIINRLQQMKENNTPINEGILTGILGGVAGATIGPAIMKAICNALGVSTEGKMGKLLTSKIVLTAIGAKIGY